MNTQATKKHKEDHKDKSLIYNEDPRARFALIASLAVVDGEVGEDEKNMLHEIARTDYNLHIDEEIDRIISDFERVTKGELCIDDVAYVHEILTNVPNENSEKIKDLKHCYDIILIDNKITEAEKNAFDIICRFYGVKKELFSNQDYEKIKENINNSTYSKYFTERDEKGKIRIKSDGYNKIREVFQYKIIRGPLLGGIEYALEKRYNEVVRNKIKNEKQSSLFAFIIFAISAFLLLTNTIKTSHHADSKHAICQSAGDEVQEPNGQDSSLVLDESNGTANCDSTRSIYQETLNKETFKYFIIFITVGILLFGNIRSFIRKNSYRFIYAGIILTCYFLREYMQSILLLFAMLSIEWLILMKGSNFNDENEKHSTPLTIFVIMAILADVSYGMIELEQNYAPSRILDKVFSALFLGCICFFTGKFLELQYRQKEKTRKEMKQVLEEINKLKQD